MRAQVARAVPPEAMVGRGVRRSPALADLTVERWRARRGQGRSRSRRLYRPCSRSRRGGNLERFAGFEDPNVGSSGMRDDEIAKPADGGVSVHRHMVERSPVIWNEMARPKPREQFQRIFTGEVPFAKRFALPPRRIPDRQKRDVQL